ncbi:hypothetical protein BDY24DRAFT_404537 [Mrakia frigida]|uniref:uncharacterized protein n=1 Tax=Mrakia frigida TaxID=29902 RepID=UPI003FCC263A
MGLDRYNLPHLRPSLERNETVDHFELEPEFDKIPLLPYLQSHPHPAFLLPSPRLSSSSSPSLKSVWSNSAASTSLGSSLEGCLDAGEQASLKALIASRDVVPMDGLNSSALTSDDEEEDGSIRSFFDETEDFFELVLFQPSWAKRRTYQALLVPSSHPSYLVLHLHPPPKKYVARGPQPSSHQQHQAPHSSIAYQRRESGSVHSSDQGVIVEDKWKGEARPGSATGSLMSKMSRSSYAGRSHFSGTSGLSGGAGMGIDGLSGAIIEEDETSAEGDRDSLYEGEERVIACQDLLESTDWSKTELGSRSGWPGSLRTAISILMKTPNEAVIWWGSQRTVIYNDAYIATIGSKHPAQFGQPASIAWGEVRGESDAPLWTEYSKLADMVIEEGKSVRKDDDLMFLDRGNGPEESYHSWRWSPIQTEDGTNGGLIINSTETTSTVLRQRSLLSLRDLSLRTASARSIGEFSEGILRALEQNGSDFSFSYLYHCKDIEVLTGSDSPDVALTLAGTVGVPYGHPSAPRVLHLNHRPFDSTFVSPDREDEEDPSGTQGSPWPFREAFISRAPVYMDNLEPELVDALEYRSWGEAPTSAVVIPISPDYSQGRLAFLVLGLNTRRAYDEDYADFVLDIQTQLRATLKGIASFESEQKRAKQLEDLDRQKTQFFTSVSHELKTPLTLIQGPLNDLANSEPSKPRKKLFQIALRNSARLVRMVESLLNFAALENGKLRGVFRPLDLSLLIEDLASLFRPAIEKGKITFHVQTEESAGRLLYLDRDLMEKIVFNLLSNAYKYSIEGSIDVRVSYLKSGHASFEVQDTGVGIPSEEIALIFERFHRVQSQARSHEGTGIGLSLTSELVHLHGAQILVSSRTADESSDGSSGSTFTVLIPFGKDHLPSNQIDDTPDTSIGGSSYAKGIVEEAGLWERSGNSSSQRSMSDSGASGVEGIQTISSLLWSRSDTILIVDDSADMRAYLVGILSPHCNVVQASDGEQALERALETRIDLLISDVSMPRMDGYQLLSAIRSNPKTASIPFIILTARAGDEERVGGILAGADDYLPKPFSANELVARGHLQMQLGKRKIELETKFNEQLKANHLLISQSPVGIGKLNSDGVMYYANDSWYRMTGHPTDRPLANWASSLSSKDVEEETLTSLAEIVQGGLGLTWSNGRSTWAQSFEADNDGGTICMLTDVTDRKNLERQEEAHQRKRAEDAEDARRHQEFLVSVISHELRNPVSAILQCTSLCKGNLTFLKDELQTSMDQQKPYSPNEALLNLISEDLEGLDMIWEMAQSQERISNDVLSMGKAAGNTLRVSSVPCELAVESERIVSTFAVECRQKHITLSLDLGPQLKALARDGLKVFQTDPTRLSQIFVNLLSNAIRFTAAAPVREIKISVDVRESDPLDESCLPPPVDYHPSSLPSPHSPYFLYGSIKDTGPGLTEHELSLLFKRFSQATPDTHAVFGGSGLGLFVCRMLVELMGGRIEVSSEPGQGSTFRFFIQLETPSQEVQSRPVVRYGVPSPSSVAARSLHVLVVEDNAINQKVLARQLSKAGLTCELASDGQEGLDLLLNSRSEGRKLFNCILMDVNMPIMDGISATKAIRSMEQSGELSWRSSIFGLTGNAQEKQVSLCLESGMDDVITKPYRIDNLLSKIASSS